MGTIDLDSLRAARREVEKEAPTVTFEGVEFTLPVEMPFAVIDAITRMGRNEVDEDDEEAKKRANADATRAMGDIARSLFGKQYKEFLELGPSNDDINAILENISELYGTDAGESQASES